MSANRRAFTVAPPAETPEKETSTLARHLWRAWCAGDHAAADAWHRSSSAARATLKSSLRRVTDQLPMARLNEVATLAVADGLAGSETDLLDLVRGAKTADPLSARYLELLTVAEPPPKPRRPPPKGHIFSWPAFKRTLAKGEAARVAALVTTPDHEGFSNFWGWIPVVAWAFTAGLTPNRRADALWEWVCCGCRPDGLEVLFERQRKKPPFDERESAAWWGFDAVARRNDELLVYHYMGVRWWAPLAFEDGLNAFWFLERLDTAWEELLQALSNEDVGWVERARSEGRVRHLVVHDSKKAPTNDQTLRRVGDHYGVSVEAVDVMRA